MAGYNLPDGCPEYLDRPPCWDDETPPELSEAELQAEYEEALDLAADAAPPNVFYECATPHAEAPLALTTARWAELRDFLRVLSRDDVHEVAQMAQAEHTSRALPFETRKPNAAAYERLGYALATGGAA